MTLTTLALLVLVQSGHVAATAANWGERVLVADGDGTVRAWHRSELAFDAGFTRKLAGDGLLAIARDGDVLWGFDGTRAFTWDDAGARWDLVKGKPPPSACTAFAVVDGKPVGTCGPGVHRFTDGKYWDAPSFKDQLEGKGFGDGPRAIAAQGHQLAIGTGYGEWGGHLWLLDVSTGAWGKHYDGRGNAVGIAWTGAAWAVAWSMSHFAAHTQVRLHGRDGKPVKEGAILRDRYLRKLAFDPEVKAVFGLEQNELVRLDDALALVKLQDVGKVKYGPEAHAVGVSPGIAVLLALGGGRFLIVPSAGDPLVVGAGKVTALRAPSIDGGAAR